MEALLTSPLGSIPLKDAVLTIGRSPNNGLFINHATVSRHHAEIRSLGQKHHVVDLGSTSGTFVNGERLAPRMPRLLQADDVLQVGSFQLTYVAQQTVSSLETVTGLPGVDLSSPSRLLSGAGTPPGSSADHPPVSALAGRSGALGVDEIGLLPPLSGSLLLAPEPPTAYPAKGSLVMGRSTASGERAPDFAAPGPARTLSASPVPVSRPLSTNLARQQLRFTAFYQPAVPVGSENVLFIYAHVESALAEVQNDVRYRKALAESASVQRVGEAASSLAGGLPITVVPVFQGLSFLPERSSFSWTDEWHPVLLHFSAHSRQVGSSSTGEILLLAGPLVIASLRVTLHFVEPGSRSAQDLEEISVVRYKNIFTSYSQDDLEMAQALRQVYEAFGDESFQDLEALRSGENWPDILPRAIDSADIFQLCWSSHAAQSSCVYQECQYAFQHYKYDGFLRPIYWEKPLAFCPPELAHLPFIYYELPGAGASRLGSP